MISKLPFKDRSGFTLVEILAVLAIMSVFMGIALTSMTDVVDDARFSQTVREMEVIRNALVGETQRLETGLRKNYGYLGDMGALPTTVQGLAGLFSKPAGASDWSMYASYGLGIGWRGPYLENTFDQNFLEDAWGNDYIYTKAVDGSATITSRGADGAAGGEGFNQDIVLSIPVAVTQGNLLGYMVQADSDLLGADQIPYETTAQIFVYYADGNGGLSSTSLNVTATDAGKYSFSSLPLGFAAVKIFIPTSAAPTETLGPTLVEVNKAATAATPVTQDNSTVFGTSSACTAGQNFSFSSSSYVKNDTDKTIQFDITFPEDYNWAAFAYEQQRNAAIEYIQVTDLSAATSASYRYSSGDSAIKVGGATNITTTGSNTFTINPAIAFSSSSAYRIKFQFSSAHWDNADTVYFFQIGCKFFRAHQNMPE